MDIDQLFQYAFRGLVYFLLPVSILKLLVAIYGKPVSGTFQCTACGYNRSGLPDETPCPECGHGPKYTGDIRHIGRHVRFTNKKQVVISCILISATIMLAVAVYHTDKARKELYYNFADAVEQGDLETAERYLAWFPELAKDQFRYDPNLVQFHTALYYAVESKDNNLIKLLLHHGADPNQGRRNLLWHLVDEGNLTTLKQLLEAGADPNRTQHGNLLCYAVALKSHEHVKVLLEYGADAKQFYSYPVLTDAINRPDRYTICKLLLEAGADPNQAASSPWYAPPPLMAAIEYKDPKTVRLLLDYGANIHIKDNRTNQSAIKLARQQISEQPDEISAQIVEMLEQHDIDESDQP